jgi:hypothetical protein
MEWNKKTGVQDTLLGRKELDMIECLGGAKEYGRRPSDDPFFAVSTGTGSRDQENRIQSKAHLVTGTFSALIIKR